MGQTNTDQADGSLAHRRFCFEQIHRRRHDNIRVNGHVFDRAASGDALKIKVFDFERDGAAFNASLIHTGADRFG